MLKVATFVVLAFLSVWLYLAYYYGAEAGRIVTEFFKDLFKEESK